jgi:hypothetical protein
LSMRMVELSVASTFRKDVNAINFTLRRRDRRYLYQDDVASSISLYTVSNQL